MKMTPYLQTKIIVISIEEEGKEFSNIGKIKCDYYRAVFQYVFKINNVNNICYLELM